jgi:hypothetical protein
MSRHFSDEFSVNPNAKLSGRSVNYPLKEGGEETEPREVFDVLVLALESSASESATNPNKEERNKCLAKRA